MRKFGSKVVLVLLVGLSVSCATNVYRPLDSSDNVIGSVQTSFKLFSLYGKVSNQVLQTAYVKLKEEAGKQYQGNFDIKNITVVNTGGLLANMSWLLQEML